MDFRGSLVYILLTILILVQIVFCSLILEQTDQPAARNLLIGLVIFNIVHLFVLAYIFYSLYKVLKTPILLKSIVLLSIAKTSAISVVFELMQPLLATQPNVYWNGVYLLGAGVLESVMSVIFV